MLLAVQITSLVEMNASALRDLPGRREDGKESFSADLFARIDQYSFPLTILSEGLLWRISMMDGRSVQSFCQ
jgi:sigma54-dependent transcription regulator